MSKYQHILWQLFITNIRLGLRSSLKGLDYYRVREYQLLFRMLEERGISGNERILDLACGEEVLPVALSLQLGKNIHACDRDMQKISLQDGFFRRLQERDNGINLARTDALMMGYKTGSFDVVINLAMVSLLEGDGDISMIHEIARILGTGGTVYMSLGYCRSASEGYDSSAKGFFRRYDDESLSKRIIAPSGLVETHRRYFGEPAFRFGRLWYRLPLFPRLLFRWASPLLTMLFCKELAWAEASDACGVLLALKKPAGGTAQVDETSKESREADFKLPVSDKPDPK